MLRRVREKAKDIQKMRPADALIILPARGTMAGFLPGEARGVNEHDGDALPDVPAARCSLSLLRLTDVLHRYSWQYDLTDEATYERCAVRRDKATHIGKRSYLCVIRADGADLAQATDNTPLQTEWKVTGAAGERRSPERIVRKDERHFLCVFGAQTDAVEDPGNLIAFGYGFCTSVTLEKVFTAPHAWASCTLLFTDIQASAGHVCLDGASVGYVYGPDWSLSVDEIKEGKHTLSMTLYNSGYNVYGPHHYYLGDAPLISPLHYQGRKHFGDPADAPDITHIPEWHFTDYHCFGQLHLLEQPIRRKEP